jgi:hypothetical protein
MTCSAHGHPCGRYTQDSSLLGRKSRLPNIGPTQLDAQYPLHRAQHFLVRGRRASLKVLHYRHGRVALGRKILLCHLRRDLVSPANDCLPDVEANGLRLDDLIASVDFGEVLAFDRGFLKSMLAIVFK